MSYLILKSIEVANNSLIGVKVPLKGASLLFIQVKEGIVGCSYLSDEVADKIGTPLAVVSYENQVMEDIEDLLDAKVINTTQEASKLGVEKGMSGETAIKIMSNSDM